MKGRNHWLAWSLHFIFGLVVGVVVGFGFLSEVRHYFPILWSRHMVTFLQGSAVLFAGLGSLYGDSLWMRNSYTVLEGDDLEHTPMSRYVSRVCVVFGIILMAIALLRNFCG